MRKKENKKTSKIVKVNEPIISKKKVVVSKIPKAKIIKSH